MLENIRPSIIPCQHQGMGNISAKQGAKVFASMQINPGIRHWWLPVLPSSDSDVSRPSRPEDLVNEMDPKYLV